MNEEVRLHLKKADDCIKDAELLISADRYFSTVGRGYYAMFHAATAALLTKDIVRRSHQGIISSFGREFIKTGKVRKNRDSHNPVRPEICCSTLPTYMVYNISPRNGYFDHMKGHDR